MSNQPSPTSDVLHPSGPAPGAVEPHAVDPIAPTPVSTPHRSGWIVAIATLLFAGLFAAGYLPKQAQRARLVADTRKAAGSAPIVALVRPKPGKHERTLTLPASLEGLEETVIYARADGYVRRWLVDMGDEVKERQVLAELDTPELDREIEQASASLAQAGAAIEQARATLDYSRGNLDRYASLSARGFSSKQELAKSRAQSSIDEANLKLAEAARTSALANLHRLEQLKSFARVLAPFAGTITERLVERGSLVSAGTSHPLFRIAAVDPLRVFVRVPQSLSAGVRPGVRGQLTLAEFPGRTFDGSVERTSGRLDPETRTLSVELRVPNADRALLPGMYASVQLALPSPHPVLIVPATALIAAQDGLKVATVGSSGRVRLAVVTLERDNGAEVEIASGLSADDEIIGNPGPGVSDELVVQRAN